MSKVKKQYPEYILQSLRGRCGMDRFDKSRDDYFQTLPSKTVFSEVVNWSGLLGGWDAQIKRWIEDIYGIDIDNGAAP